MERLIFLDIESTGLAWTEGDRIIQLACLEEIGGKPTGNDRNQYICPKIGNKIRLSHPKAYQVHGIDTSLLRTKPTFDEIAGKFVEYIADSPLVAHCGNSFDFPFLEYELGFTLKNEKIDTYELAKGYYPNESCSLDSLMRKFGLPPRGKHSALGDCMALREVALRMTEDCS